MFDHKGAMWVEKNLSSQLQEDWTGRQDSKLVTGRLESTSK